MGKKYYEWLNDQEALKLEKRLAEFGFTPKDVLIKFANKELMLSASSTQVEGKGMPATPSPHINCIFGYWRKDKDGNFNNVCFPRKEDPSLIDDRITLVSKFCQQCDMKQKALIRYKRFIESPHTTEIQKEYEIEFGAQEPITKQCLSCGYTFWSNRALCPQCRSDKLKVLEY